VEDSFAAELRRLPLIRKQSFTAAGNLVFINTRRRSLDPAQSALICVYLRRKTFD
jgi:hypothetical protein